MKASVDYELCIGCGLCVSVCPDVFRLNREKAIAYVDTVAAQYAAACTSAAAQCPVDAITVE